MHNIHLHVFKTCFVCYLLQRNIFFYSESHRLILISVLVVVMGLLIVT